MIYESSLQVPVIDSGKCIMQETCWEWVDCCKEHIPSKKNIQTSRYDIMNKIGKNSLLKLNILTYKTYVLLGFSEGPADMKVGKGL